jgi:hypothetical protein
MSCSKSNVGPIWNTGFVPQPPKRISKGVEPLLLNYFWPHWNSPVHPFYDFLSVSLHVGPKFRHWNTVFDPPSFKKKNQRVSSPVAIQIDFWPHTKKNTTEKDNNKKKNTTKKTTKKEKKRQQRKTNKRQKKTTKIKRQKRQQKKDNKKDNKT